MLEQPKGSLHARVRRRCLELSERAPRDEEIESAIKKAIAGEEALDRSSRAEWEERVAQLTAEAIRARTRT